MTSLTTGIDTPHRSPQGERHPRARFVNRAACFLTEGRQASANERASMPEGNSGSFDRVAVVTPEVGPYREAEATYAMQVQSRVIGR
jgi:hypothetical protein